MTRCPFCGQANPGSTCPSCGGRLPDAPPIPPAPGPPTSPPTTATPNDATCWSCGGARHAAGICPWCGAAGPARALTPDEQAQHAARRQAVLHRIALFSVIALVAAATATATALLWRDRQRDKDWKEDRIAAANATKAAIEGLVLDPAASDMTAVQNAASSLNLANADLANVDGHTEDRQQLDQHIEEFRRALDALVDVGDQPLTVLDESDAARARAQWGALADDADGIFELTGVRVDVTAAQGKVNAFLDERIRRAQVEQRLNAARVLKSQLATHRDQVEGILAEYERLRAELDGRRLGEREADGFFPFDIIRIFDDAAADTDELAQSLRATGGPTPGLSARVQRMTGIIDELAGAYARVEDLSGGCRVTENFEYVCQRIGDLPEYKRMVTDTTNAHRRLLDEKRAWSAEVDSETAKVDQQLATA